MAYTRSKRGSGRRSFRGGRGVRRTARRGGRRMSGGSQRTGGHTLRIVVDHANLQQPLPPGVMQDNSVPRKAQF